MEGPHFRTNLTYVLWPTACDYRGTHATASQATNLDKKGS
jgi:hypothetical protein